MGHNPCGSSPLLSLLREEDKKSLPFAEPTEPESLSPMLRSMLDEAEVEVPPGIAAILDACPQSVTADVIETYRAGVELDDVEIEQSKEGTHVVTDEYTFTLGKRVYADPEDFNTQVLIRYILRQAEIQLGDCLVPGAEAVIRICICGSTTCGIGPHSWVKVRLN